MEAASIPWRPIGELFVEKGVISQDQLEEALAEQAATGRRLGEILVKRNLISSPELTQALMEQLGREVAKEEGFGTGLWSEIRRRNATPGPGADADELTRNLAAVPDEPLDASAPVGFAAIGEYAQLGEADILRESLTEAHVQIEVLRRNVAERDNRLEVHEKENATLREAALALDDTRSTRVDALEHELAATLDELRAGQAQVEELEATVLERDGRIADLQTAMDEHVSRPQDASVEARASALEQELGIVQAQVAELATSLSGANEKASALESALTAEREAHTETRQRLDDSARAEENARQALREIERALDAAQTERDAARAEAAASHDALGERENDFAILREQSAAAEAALDAEREAHADTRRHADQASADAAQSRQVLDGIEQERRELAEHARTLEEEVASGHAKGSRLEGELRDAQHRTDELDGHVAGLDEQLEAVRRERDELAERARTLDEDLAARHANGLHLEEQVQAAECRTAELSDKIVSLAGRLATAESALEEAETAREAARRDADEAAAKLDEADGRIAELNAIVDRLDTEKARLSKKFSDQRVDLQQEVGTLGSRLAAESAAHSETRCVLSQALTELAAREVVPALSDESEPGPQDYLCFTPTNDGYRLLVRTGLQPTAGDECDVDGIAHVVTRVARSPLPFDPRTCVYLMAAA